MELTKRNLKMMLLGQPHTRGFLLQAFGTTERKFRRFTSKCIEEGVPIVVEDGIYHWDRKRLNKSLKTRYKTAISHLRVISRYNKQLKKQLQYDLFHK